MNFSFFLQIYTKFSILLLQILKPTVLLQPQGGALSGSSEFFAECGVLLQSDVNHDGKTRRHV